jgi:DNA modification methylase
MTNKKSKQNKKEPLSWMTVKRNVSSMVPYSKNPRLLSQKQENDLRRSLEKYNLVEIPVLNRDGTVIAGHQRLKILQLLGRGEETIDCRMPSRQLSEAEFKEYLVRSNISNATWNYEMLASDFDVATLLEAGFEDADLSAVYDDVLSVDDDNFDVDRAVAAAKKTTIKPGDLFQIGPHRILCANSELPETVKRLVGKEKIDLVNIDGPYNLGLDYNAGVGGKQSYGGHVDDRKSDEDYRKFLKNIITNAISVSKENSHFFFWSDERHVGLLQELYKESGIDFRRLCAWLKGSFNPVPSCAFNRAAEWCTYGTRGKNPYLSDRVKNLTEVMNREIDSGNRMLSDITDLFSIWVVRRLPAQEMQHPTEKPPSLYDKSLRRCSKPGDAVLDLCSGSGSLGVACESLKRRAFLCDQEPVFCQVAVDRLVKLSNYHVKKLN